MRVQTILREIGEFFRGEDTARGIKAGAVSGIFLGPVFWFYVLAVNEFTNRPSLMATAPGFQFYMFIAISILGMIVGVPLGAVFGVIYAKVHNYLTGESDLAKAAGLSLVYWPLFPLF